MSGAKNDGRRGLKTAQIKMRLLSCSIVAATSVVGGFDKHGIKQVIKNAAGDFTIILKNPYDLRNANKAEAMVMPLTAGVTWYLAAASHDRVNVILSADVDFKIWIMGQDYKLSH